MSTSAPARLAPDGMRELLTHPWLATLPTYLETPGHGRRL